MAFGMGMCCLQVTFQARDVDESRYMYDQLAVLSPIMMAMTAATPIFKGRLADIDVRWTVISQSVDDRTPAERGLISPDMLSEHVNDYMAGQGIRSIPKSRYDSISTYIYHCRGEPACQRTFAAYNDINCPEDDEMKSLLRREGVDENLSHHIAHLFIRDPIVAFNGQVQELNDEESTNHFESIQSTNWQSCRWKPPPHQPPALSASVTNAMLKDADDALHEAESTLRWFGDVTAITYKTVANGDLKSLQLQKLMDEVIATLNSSKERPPGNMIIIAMV